MDSAVVILISGIGSVVAVGGLGTTILLAARSQAREQAREAGIWTTQFTQLFAGQVALTNKVERALEGLAVVARHGELISKLEKDVAELHKRIHHVAQTAQRLLAALELVASGGAKEDIRDALARSDRSWPPGGGAGDG